MSLDHLDAHDTVRSVALGLGAGIVALLEEAGGIAEKILMAAVLALVTGFAAKLGQHLWARLQARFFPPK